MIMFCGYTTCDVLLFRTTSKGYTECPGCGSPDGEQIDALVNATEAIHRKANQ